MKVVAIIQARLSSSRLPAKVMLDLAGKTVLERVVNRVKLASDVDKIVIATSDREEDNIIVEFSNQIGIESYRGSLENVMNRFHNVAKLTNADIIIRVTADNPLTEPSFIDKLVKSILEGGYDYVAMNNIPIGSGVEVFTAKSFNKFISEYKLNDHNLEHVTSFYYQNPDIFKLHYVDSGYLGEDIGVRLTLDTFEDYVRLSKIHKNLIKSNIDPKDFLGEILSKHKK